MQELMAATPLKEMDGAMLTSQLMSIIGHDLHNSVDAMHVSSALSFAAYLHQGDTRSTRAGYPVTPYIEHPLRNTIRGIRFGFTSETIIISSLLHDVVEDQPENILRYFKLASTKDLTEEEIRACAVEYIAGVYGQNVANTVLRVSNPILPGTESNEEKREAYFKHFLEITETTEPYAVKLMDLIDNAGSLTYMNSPDPEKITKRAKKYEPVIEYICDTLFSSPISEMVSVTQLSLIHRKFGIILKDIKLLKNIT